jgi:hypothetical protein
VSGRRKRAGKHVVFPSTVATATREPPFSVPLARDAQHRKRVCSANAGPEVPDAPSSSAVRNAPAVNDCDRSAVRPKYGEISARRLDPEPLQDGQFVARERRGTKTFAHPPAVLNCCDRCKRMPMSLMSRPAAAIHAQPRIREESLCQATGKSTPKRSRD